MDGMAVLPSLRLRHRTDREDSKSKDALFTEGIYTPPAIFTRAVSMSAITSTLTDVYGNDAISFVASGLGGAQNLNAVTLLDRSTKLGIARKLMANADGTLSAKENVIVTFIPYGAITR
ncbi:hypothetical protein E1N52_36770 [Paraburkholderia guartelaensis]|uniref:Uncharacterized protein n=1 Tax=Paraburkholderia guartelaensis TaxID=2546446 RepID=A0A4R5L2Z9_9BURK|nr:hypothetical protein [Paraburkholderia guartelaensis]TDG02996.1 hypothetical protein E1N52_36770 [Paraburkholderia guartelaensis]